MVDEFATINGHRLRYRLRGEGALAIFGHGLLGSIEQIDDRIGDASLLQGIARLLLFDARGHGQSDGPDRSDDYRWESLGLDMVALADHFGEETATFGGASMGAASALWVGVERPERVRALVLLMPPPLGPLEIRGDDEKRAVAALDFISAAVQNYGLEKTAELAKSIPGLEGDPEERAVWIRSQNPRALAYAIRGLLQSPFHDPEAYRTVQAPTIVIAHEGDGLHPIRSAILLRDTIPNCHLVVAPDPGYWRTHPQEFIDELKAFRDSVA